MSVICFNCLKTASIFGAFQYAHTRPPASWLIHDTAKFCMTMGRLNPTSMWRCAAYVVSKVWGDLASRGRKAPYSIGVSSVLKPPAFRYPCTSSMISGVSGLEDSGADQILTGFPSYLM